ncbi:UDP-N-acetylmuramate dehydrogenase [Paenibacillus glycanilyticus]|uniref:UDP-N-acetylmuramate dehydrogenase n=1 Tax=Paenibacillus glycanilyticus TaxID=126569 RepID=UPI00255A2968
MNMKQIIHQLIPQATVTCNESLQPYTYTRTGGPAEILIKPSTYEDIEKIVIFASSHKIPLTILGNGSNVIVRDGGIKGIVLLLTTLQEIKKEDDKIIAQAGVPIIEVSRYALDQGLTGLEFCCGVPGTVGGAIFMNAGCYGGEMRDVVESVLVINSEGVLQRLTNDMLEFDYRKSCISKHNYIVLEAVFQLRPGIKLEIERKMEELTRLREEKQPLEFPSCGSVFKRPPGHFAGQLIQESGLKGEMIGGVQVSTKHAGFMVNVNEGTATDYIRLIERVKTKVHEKFNISLEPEVRIIGESLEEQI